jgi:hypothetical protein
MLAYVLALDRKSLMTHCQGGPIMVVDDCSLSGHRFGNFLRDTNHEEVVFAHLYSHPALRSAIRDREPRVVDCFAARDLRDLASEHYPDSVERRRWRERWEERLPGKRYWVGLPELVIFPWSEPDRPVLDSATGQVDNGWRIAPPDRCLKNWALLGLPPREGARRTLRTPEKVAFHSTDGAVFLCDLGSEEVYGLEGIAADMWRALAAYGDIDTAADSLLARYEVGTDRLHADLVALVAELSRRGLMEAAEAS